MRIVWIEEADYRPGDHERKLLDIRSRSAPRLRIANLRAPAGVALVARRSLPGDDMEQRADLPVANIVCGPDTWIQGRYLVHHAQLIDSPLTVNRVSSSHNDRRLSKERKLLWHIECEEIQVFAEGIARREVGADAPCQSGCLRLSDILGTERMPDEVLDAEHIPVDQPKRATTETC